MAPGTSIFENLDAKFRGLAWPGHEYVLGTDAAMRGMVADLPAGQWTVTRYDLIKQKSVVLATDARGRFAFDSPARRAVLFHFDRTHP